MTVSPNARVQPFFHYFLRDAFRGAPASVRPRGPFDYHRESKRSISSAVQMCPDLYEREKRGEARTGKIRFRRLVRQRTCY